jgi:DNA polymerase-3 subunit beta
VVIDRELLIKAIERVSVLATDSKNRILRFDIKKDLLSLTVETREVGKAKEECYVESNVEMEIAFNIKYLLEGLKNIPGNDVRIELNDPNTPVVLSPLGIGKMTYLVMPVQIRE